MELGLGSLDQSCTEPAVVSSVGLDTATLGTFVDHLTGLELQALYKLLGRVPFRHRTLGERHGLGQGHSIIPENQYTVSKFSTSRFSWEDNLFQD